MSSHNTEIFPPPPPPSEKLLGKIQVILFMWPENFPCNAYTLVHCSVQYLLWSTANSACRVEYTHAIQEILSYTQTLLFI